MKFKMKIAHVQTHRCNRANEITIINNKRYGEKKPEIETTQLLDLMARPEKKSMNTHRLHDAQNHNGYS